MKIVFKTSKTAFLGELKNSRIAQKLYEKIPFTSKICLWGEEIYFKIPLKAKARVLTLDVEVGDIAYWPEGSCLCIFLGRTPFSKTDKPVPASEVEIVGKVLVERDILKDIKSGEKITLLQG